LLACGLSLLKKRIKFIEHHYYEDNVKELKQHLKILVIDLAKKLQMATKHQRAEQDGSGYVAEPLSMCYQSLLL